MSRTSIPMLLEVGSLVAPDHRGPTVEASRLLREWFGNAPETRKLVCLLDHRYTPDGLSFGALKNRDGAVARVLRDAAAATDLAIHLAIVHIEETGAAEIIDEPPSRRRWYSGSRSYREDEDDDEEECEDDGDEEEDEDFEAVFSNGVSFELDEFRSVVGVPVAFGTLPFLETEIVPVGALRDEPPDVKRVTEATGNEGASYERSYHRAGLVLWPRRHSGEILLEAGPEAALPYLRELLDQRETGDTGVTGAALVRLADAILECWSDRAGYEPAHSPAHRMAWFEAVTRIGSKPLAERSVEQIAGRWFDGAEAIPLVRACLPLGPKGAVDALGAVITARFPDEPVGCVELVAALLDEPGATGAAWRKAFVSLAEALVDRLGTVRLPVQPRRSDFSFGAYHFPVPTIPHPVDGGFVVRLVTVLERCGGSRLVASAAEALTAHPEIYPPGKTLVPALGDLAAGEKGKQLAAVSYRNLWEATATALVRVTSAPPRSPNDWSQRRRVKCGCSWCAEINAFAADPHRQVHRIRAKKELRSHMHGNIDDADLEMSHVTERRGSPYTLVLTKDRRVFGRKEKRFREDVRAAEGVAGLAPAGCANLVAALRENLARLGEA